MSNSIAHLLSHIQALSDEPDYPLSCQLLLASILGKSPSFVYAHPEYVVDGTFRGIFNDGITRLVTGEPLAYVLGYKDFYHHRFLVTPAVLIPRPETEGLIELVRQHMSTHFGELQNKAVIVDVGTGSGCIALSLALLYPHAKVYAIDVSRDALKVARLNAQGLSVHNITFLHGSLLGPLDGLLEPHSVDVIVANLPYISDEEYDQLPKNIRDFEPALALRSGIDPDTLNNRLLKQAKVWMKSQGLLVYESTNGKICSIND